MPSTLKQPREERLELRLRPEDKRAMIARPAKMNAALVKALRRARALHA